MTTEYELFKADSRFEGVLLGRLRSGETYIVRFPYTRDGMKEIRKGLFIGIENFHSDETIARYSILQIVKVEPIDYALGSSADKLLDEYPGFVEEAAKSTVPLWEQETPEEETTRIQVEAVPVGVMIEQDRAGGFKLTDDISLPKLGATARLLTSNVASNVVNREVPRERSIILGTLLEDENVPFKINAAELCRTHLGIFGFTRAGKSNLASNIVAAILNAAQRQEESGLRGAKAVVIDYTNEYFPLLADCFKESEETYLLVLDPGRLPRDFARAVESEEIAKSVAEKLLGNMVVPADLSEPDKINALVNVLKDVLLRRGVKVCTLTTLSIEAARRLRSVISSYDPRHIGRARDALYSWPEWLNAQESLTVEDLRSLASRLEDDVRNRRATRLRLEEEGRISRTTLSSFVSGRTEESSHLPFAGVVANVSDTAVYCMEKMARELRELSSERSFIEGLPPDMRLEKEELIKILNDAKNAGLFIATSDRTDDLSLFLHDVTEGLYDERRRHGIKEPLVLFMVDEADEFVPQKAEAMGTRREDSRKAAELLARRGGKLGMGIGLATQRVAYLDTRVIGNLHTYFVSKLPRKSDRERIAEAFGISVEVVDRTLELRRGQWMVISHSAAGIPVTPFLIRFPKAEERVLKALNFENTRT